MTEGVLSGKKTKTKNKVACFHYCLAGLLACLACCLLCCLRALASDISLCPDYDHVDTLTDTFLIATDYYSRISAASQPPATNTLHLSLLPSRCCSSFIPSKRSRPMQHDAGRSRCRARTIEMYLVAQGCISAYTYPVPIRACSHLISS
jgi:hypothetical protein